MVWVPLVAEVDMNKGGRITSLRGADIEWLLQPAGLPPQDNSFVGSGLAGWDECIPTVAACTGADGRAVPDHGSVWAREWTVDGNGYGTVQVEQFRFGRRIRHSQSGLRLDYLVHSIAEEPIAVLWAAHPQVLSPPGTAVEIAVGDRGVLEVYPGPPRIVPWHQIRSIDAVPNGAARKIYLPVNEPVSAARLIRPDGRWLEWRWDPQLVPHLGVWFDNGAYAAQSVIAIEPAIGWYDSLDMAANNGTAMRLAAGETRRWWLALRVGRDELG